MTHGGTDVGEAVHGSPPCGIGSTDGLARVAVLFAREDSVYKTLPGCEVYDMARDARTYDGPWPVVAHPPCRGWGRLRHMAKPRADERNLARLAVALVREFGGVLEHPEASTLWPAQRLPAPGQRDGMGGWTMCITQHWWGHRATKATLLYIVGCEPQDIPPLPELRLGDGTHIVSQDGRRADGSRLAKGDPRKRPECTKPEREHTPTELALWLVELARRCQARANVGVRPLSPKARKLAQELESMGHRSVRVWWERIGMAMEMCGPSGGWFCESDMTHFQPEPLGLSFAAALQAVRTHSWLDFRHVPRAA